VQVVWVARHSHIGDAFFDLDAAEFLLDELKAEQMNSDTLVSSIEGMQQLIALRWRLSSSVSCLSSGG
jgi:hypothetical protein